MIALDFTGKNVLVTGGSRGIGRATALAFAECGANVAITYSTNTEAAEKTRVEIQAFGVHSMAFVCDSGDERAIELAIEKIQSEWGSLDVLVCNAGIWNEGKITTLELSEFEGMMRANMTGTFLACKHAARVMTAQGSGSIVIISSTAGQRGESEHAHYAASKGAQISFTKSLASELATKGIRVNCVAPGWVNTDMTTATLQDATKSKKVFNTIPLGRVAEPIEIANAILFLSSTLASFITGEILNVNGGAVLCG